MLAAACATIRQLADNPGIGHPFRFRRGRLGGIRAKQVNRFRHYLIFYRGCADGVEIIRVLHGSRDLGSLFPE